MGSEYEALCSLLLAAGVSDRVAQRLGMYGELLLAANRLVNLTGAKDAETLVPHLLDSLTLASDVHDRLIDVGSGGGLPGIPLAIATGVPIALVEPIAKKAAFLQKCLSALGMEGLVINDRAEVAAREGRFREQFAFATARAVSSVSTVAELTIPFLRIGGRALLQRGSFDEAEQHTLDDAAPILGAALVEVRLLDGARRVLILEKRLATSVRFPRRNGVPEKRPLCV
jgi:16S rRNA (guanine527-N7)-methyltransferase